MALSGNQVRGHSQYTIQTRSHVQRGDPKTSRDVADKRSYFDYDNISVMSQVSSYSYQLRPRDRSQPTLIQMKKQKVTPGPQRRRRVGRPRRGQSKVSDIADQDKMEQFSDANSNYSMVSCVSNVSGFGAYNTRNFKKFNEATQAPIVTRKKYSQIIQSRPEVGQISKMILEKNLARDPKKNLAQPIPMHVSLISKQNQNSQG